ncbi:MAG: hypothetical protein N3F06_03290, partial [Nitrososphaerales archaeon]|nr:hypothetical protein [Nitrososphaerales archaeon]
NRAEILLKVESIDVKDSYIPQVYCRANFITIESIIHATRVRAFLSQKRLSEADELIRLIEYYNTTVCRIAPNSIYSTIMSNLLKRVNEWKSCIDDRV